MRKRFEIDRIQTLDKPVSGITVAVHSANVGEGGEFLLSIGLHSGIGRTNARLIV